MAVLDRIRVRFLDLIENLPERGCTLVVRCIHQASRQEPDLALTRRTERLRAQAFRKAKGQALPV